MEHRRACLLGVRLCVFVWFGVWFGVWGIAQAWAEERNGQNPAGTSADQTADEAVGGPAVGEPDEAMAQAEFARLARPFDPATATETAAAWVRLAERFPSTSVAPDALFLAAQQYEETLSRPEEALKLYQRLVERYPDSRLYKRAKTRAEQLVGNLRSGEKQYAAFLQIVKTTEAHSVARKERLEKLLSETPDFARADQVLYLLLDGALRRDDATGEARYAVLVGRFPDSDFAAQGHKAYAEFLLRRGDFGRARQVFEALSRHKAPLWRETAQAGLRAVSKAKTRRETVQVAGAVLGMALLALGVRHRRHLWPPPWEFFYYAPVGLFLLLVSSLAQGRVFVRALSMWVLCGSLLVWLFAAASRTRAPRSLLWGLVWRGVLSVLLCYWVVEQNGLWDFVVETLRNGPEPT